MRWTRKKRKPVPRNKIHYIRDRYDKVLSYTDLSFVSNLNTVEDIRNWTENQADVVITRLKREERKQRAAELEEREKTPSIHIQQMELILKRLLDKLPRRNK